MRIDPDSGVLVGARQVASPNCDERPPGAGISLLVIHGISLPPGRFGGPWIDALFTNCLDPNAHRYFQEIQHLKVSAHAMINRRGRITQYVPFTRRAWHAGVSAFDGCERCNDFSIGIELEGTDERRYTQKQFRTLVTLTRRLMQVWPAITPQRVARHSDIAPGRKTDPGPGFDWSAYQCEIGHGVNPNR